MKLKSFLTALFVLAFLSIGFAQLTRNAVIVKPNEQYVDFTAKDQTKNIVKVNRNIELFDIQGLQTGVTFTTRAFSLPAYGDSIKFNYSAYDTSHTGNANLTLILKGVFYPGDAGTTLDTLVNKDSSETVLHGSFTVAGTVYPYYTITIAKPSGSPIDAVFKVLVFPVAMKNPQ